MQAEKETSKSTETGSKMPRPLILVCGFVGSGKTGLIRAACPSGTVPGPEEAANLSSDGTVIYETDVADFVDCRGFETSETAAEYLESLGAELAKMRPDTSGSTFYFAWICVAEAQSKLQRGETDLLEKLRDRSLAVVTNPENPDCEAGGKTVEMIARNYPNDRIISVSTESGAGVARLLETTLQHLLNRLPDSAREGFAEAWHECLNGGGLVAVKSPDEMADSYVNWAAGRAFVIALTPLPLSDVGPLVANEAYMIYRIGAAYGYAVDDRIIAGIVGCIGGSLVGKMSASFLPFVKAPIAAAVTYGVGAAAKGYFASGMTLGNEELKEVFRKARNEAESFDWRSA
jgi:uncharacterized protein (DUF697 family)